MTARVHSRGRVRAKPSEGFLDHLLDPIDRLAETIYSILIFLTFTLAFRVIKLEPNEIVSADYVNDLLIAAFLAILAWGNIDGIVYMLTEVLERGEKHRVLWHIQSADTEEDAIKAVHDEIGFVLEPITGETQRRQLYLDVIDHLRDSQPQPVRLKRADFTGALACVFVAVVVVLPSLLPFAVLRHDYALAIRVSNVISFAMLFYAGYEWGKYTGASRWKTGLVLVGVGMLLVAIAIPLGG